MKLRCYPNVFHAKSVRALLAGTQTQLRHTVSFPRGAEYDGYDMESFDVMCSRPNGSTGTHRLATHYSVGDLIWVKETWAIDAEIEQVRRENQDTRVVDVAQCHGPYYRADGVHEDTGLTWRAAMSMPKWASRITIEVTRVRVERLQEISEEDAKAGGAAGRISPGGDLAGAFDHCDTPINYRNHFQELWDNLHGPHTPWKSNPYVWVYDFKRVEGT